MANLDPVTGKNKGGRPEGALSKLSREAREQARLGGDLPHEFLLKIMRGEIIKRRKLKNPKEEDGEIIEIVEDYGFDTRVEAAKAAAPYYAPKISTVEVISGVSDDDLDAIIARAAAEAGLSLGPGGEGPQEESQGSAPVRRERRKLND